MQDVRIRTGVVALLSISAFLSVIGAAAAFIWWLIFAKKPSLEKSGIILPTLVVIGFFSIVLELTGGGGISYFFRMLVIILLGTWLLQEQKQGDFLNLGTWLLGSRTGFELGMIAEMGIQTLELLRSDFYRIRIASDLKGLQWGAGSLIPTGLILIHRALTRAEETAEVLAVRGYTCGGSLEPVFLTTRSDITGGICALCTVVFVMIPVSEFFILS